MIWDDRRATREGRGDRQDPANATLYTYLVFFPSRFTHARFKRHIIM